MPVIVPGCAGAVAIVMALVAAELLPDALVAATVTLPAVEPKVTVIEVVPSPAVIEAPAGTVHARAVQENRTGERPQLREIIAAVAAVRQRENGNCAHARIFPCRQLSQLLIS